LFIFEYHNNVNLLYRFTSAKNIAKYAIPKVRYALPKTTDPLYLLAITNAAIVTDSELTKAVIWEILSISTGSSNMIIIVWRRTIHVKMSIRFWN